MYKEEIRQEKRNSTKYGILPLESDDHRVKESDAEHYTVMSIYYNLKKLENTNQDDADEILEKLMEINLSIIKKIRLNKNITK